MPVSGSNVQDHLWASKGPSQASLQAVAAAGSHGRSLSLEPAPKEERDLIAEVPLDLTKEVNGEKVKSKVCMTQHIPMLHFPGWW